jgi:integrase/recombinase XerD
LEEKMDISDAVQGYLFAYKAEGFSIATIENYERHLLVFCKYFPSRTIESISIEDLRSFFTFLRDEYRPEHPGRKTIEFSQASHQFYWRALRSFYRWCEKELGIPNISMQLPRPHYKPPEIQPFTNEEVKALLRACSRQKFDYMSRGKHIYVLPPNRLRDEAILSVLLDTGVRVGELTRITVGDVDFSTGEIVVQPFSTGLKTKARRVYMGNVTRSTLWKYIISRKRKRGEPRSDDRLFLTNDGREMNRFVVRDVLRRLAARSGVKNVHPHRFRHTAAVMYLRNGGDIFTLQRMLGHSSLNMVRYYLTLSDVDLQAKHRDVSPVDRLT